MAKTAKIKVPVSVYQRHIDDAERGDGAHCMVARAFCEQYNLEEDAEIVSVDGRTIAMSAGSGGDVVLDAGLPAHVQRKIEKWDEDIDPQPFDFEVSLPADWRERLNRTLGK